MKKKGIYHEENLKERLSMFVGWLRLQHHHRIMVVSHDGALSCLLNVQTKEVEEVPNTVYRPSWQPRRYLRFRNCEMRYFWFTYDGLWIPAPDPVDQIL